MCISIATDAAQRWRQTMRLIDADVLREGLGFADPCEKCDHVYGKFLCADAIWQAVCDAIYEAPTIDAVPVVRCKDCTYYEYSNAGDFCSSTGAGMPEDGYCSDGERKAEP